MQIQIVLCYPHNAKTPEKVASFSFLLGTPSYLEEIKTILHQMTEQWVASTALCDIIKGCLPQPCV